MLFTHRRKEWKQQNSQNKKKTSLNCCILRARRADPVKKLQIWWCLKFDYGLKTVIACNGYYTLSKYFFGCTYAPMNLHVIHDFYYQFIAVVCEAKDHKTSVMVCIRPDLTMFWCNFEYYINTVSSCCVGNACFIFIWLSLRSLLQELYYQQCCSLPKILYLVHQIFLWSSVPPSLPPALPPSFTSIHPSIHFLLPFHDDHDDDTWTRSFFIFGSFQCGIRRMSS